MTIDQDYINKLSELSNEVLKDQTLSPAARLLIETLTTTTQILFHELKEAKSEIRDLKERIKVLEVKLNKDSHNSHLPPSSDRKKSRYPDNRKSKGSKSSGGQSGHSGSTLRESLNPDEIILHKLKGRCRCGLSLVTSSPKETQKRQVFDLEFKTRVTQHEAEVHTCSCGKKHAADFPEGVNAFVQYGSGVRSLVNYLSSYQLIPFERLEEIFKDIFQIQLCEGTIFNTNQMSYQKLDRFESQLKEALLNSDVNHADETPIRIGKSQSYLHVLSNAELTLLYPHASRGSKALLEMNILPRYQGILSSDFFAMYYSYPFKNAVCHSHLSRELTLIEEEYHCRWAHELRTFFLDLNSYLEMYRENDVHPPRHELDLFYEEFRAIIFKARIETHQWDRIKGERTPAGNLLYRIITYEEAVLRFMYDLRVPFTNNQAERDLRMAKVRQKVSGCFRSIEGAKIYARMRSYLSTVKKQGRNLWKSLKVLHESQNPQFIELFT